VKKWSVFAPFYPRGRGRLIDIEDITKKVIEIVKRATNIRTKTGWVTQEDSFPLITIFALGQRPEKILGEVAIYRFTYQIDVWHNSMLECDREAKKIIDSFINCYKTENWFSLNFVISDFQEEGVFRKIIRVEFGAIG